MIGGMQNMGDDHFVLANGVFYGRMNGQDFTCGNASFHGASYSLESTYDDIRTRDGGKSFYMQNAMARFDLTIRATPPATWEEPPPQIITVGDVTLMDVFQFANGMIDKR